MITGIHQPNFFPWIGFFRKIFLSDYFFFLDDAIVHKKNLDYLNRTYLIKNKQKGFFSVPIKKNFLTKKINEIEISSNLNWKQNFINLLKENYKNCSNYDHGIKFICKVLEFESNKISEFNIFTIKSLLKQLEIKKEIFLSSSYNLNSKSSLKLLDLINIHKSNLYLTGTGSYNYLDIQLFKKNNIEIKYLQSDNIRYKQYEQMNFINGLSIIDVFMNVKFHQIYKLFE